MGGALFGFDEEGVVGGVRGANEEVDGGELGEGKEELGFGYGGIADDAGSAVAVVGVGDGGGEGGGALREVRGVELVDVNGSTAVGRGGKVGGAAADVSGLEGDVAGEFALDVDRELLDAGCLELLVEAGDGGADAGKEAGGVAGWFEEAGGKRVIEGVGGGLIAVV